jgi:hypothetical protein
MGVHIGTPEFVNSFVRSKAHAIEQDVQKFRIVLMTQRFMMMPI